MTRRSRLAWLLAIGVLSPAAVAHAADSTAAECVAAAEQGQKLQSQGQLLLAKEKLLSCGRDACPRVIRQDCTRWEGEVEAALPSVVFGVKDEQGNDVTDVKVWIDGVPTLTELTGTATPLDPGSHKFLFRRPGSPQPLRASVLIRVGEKNRLVTAQWGKGSAGAGGEGGSSEVARGPRPLAGYILLGAGGVAAALATYGLIAGLTSTASMKSPTGCGMSLGGCSPGQINSAQAQLWLGDIAAPVSAISIAVGLYLLLRAPDAPPATPAVSVGLQPGGGFVSWTRAF